MSYFCLKNKNKKYEYNPDGDEGATTLVSPHIFQNLIDYKNRIDTLEDTKIWDRSKKYCNMWELIHLPNKKNKKNSIALYDPLSRSYFKLWEMIKTYKLIEDNSDYTDYKSLSLAEGPGGFVECINNYTKKKGQLFAITLRSTNKDIPGWKKSKKFLNDNQNITITYGSNNTGNLYDVQNIKSLRDLVGKDCDLITADGGFDFSCDFNNQEQLSYRIIFCEIISMMATLKKEGHFVCKIFDIYTEFTAQMLWILCENFEEVHITKPFTSRPANSEKYIICKNYYGISDEQLNKYYDIVENWTDDASLGISVPGSFFKALCEYNDTITELQRVNIKKTLEIIENQDNPVLTDTLILKQRNHAVEWCHKFDITINKDSEFLK